MPRVQQVKATTSGRAKKKKATNGDGGPRFINLGYEAGVEVETLRRHPKNARRSDVEAIESSVDANGFYGALVVRKKDRTIAAGHGRMDGAVRKGAHALPVIWIDCDDATLERIVAADNRTNDLAGYDPAAHAALLSSLQRGDNLLGTGYSPEDVAKLLARSAPPTSFVGFDASAPTQHVCPKCGFQFNGGAKK